MEELSQDADHGCVKTGQEGVAFLVQQASRAFDAQISAMISQYGLDSDAYKILRHTMRGIQASPDGILLAELGRELNIPIHELADTSRRLERDGWLKTHGAETLMRIMPTRRAVSTAPVLADVSHWMHEGALNGFSHEEIDQLTAFLKRVAHNLELALGQD